MDINSKELLPGDLLILHEGDIIPCDCILLRG
jgi:magnesium-transporting ATPase (P-type)